MNGNYNYDIVVPGGGIVGLASAYIIMLSHPEIRIAVPEKEDKLTTHQTCYKVLTSHMVTAFDKHDFYTKDGI